MAPEILRGRNESDPKIDVWSLGVMLYGMIMGDYPFYDQDKDALRRQILEREIEFDFSSFGPNQKKIKNQRGVSVLKKVQIEPPTLQDKASPKKVIQRKMSLKGAGQVNTNNESTQKLIKPP